MPVGCASQLIGNAETPLSPNDAARLGCRPDDRIDKAYIAQDSDPGAFNHAGKAYLTRAYKVSQNTVTA
jgi:hypothetical protein